MDTRATLGARVTARAAPRVAVRCALRFTPTCRTSFAANEVLSVNSTYGTATFGFHVDMLETLRVRRYIRIHVLNCIQFDSLLCPFRVHVQIVIIVSHVSTMQVVHMQVVHRAVAGY